MSARAQAFHANPWSGVFYVTGGGMPFLAEMLSTPGASGSVLEVNVPYASQALTELLGRKPEQAASDITARQLAMAAYQRAQSLAPDHGERFGLGCTASLATNREKKGAHRAHWALQTATVSLGFSATYSGDRASEEALLKDQLWDTLRHLVEEPGPTPGVEVIRARPEVDVSRLLKLEPARHCVGEHGGQLLLPGSFNPIHTGHRRMLATAESLTGLSGAYELALINADKPALDFISLKDRLTAIDDKPVWITNTPTYAQKAALFPGATFAIGVDTLTRIGELRFYDHNHAKLDAALALFTELDIQFLVFGRLLDGAFQTLSSLNLPEPLVARCTEVAEADFRNDISSTELRN